MPECVNYSRKWLCLGNKYFLTSRQYQQYKYQYLACKYKYNYQYPKIVLKYRSSTSTSTQYNKTDTNAFSLNLVFVSFLPRDATQSVVLLRQSRLSVTLRYRDHIGWKSSKIISLLVSLWCSISATCNPQHQGCTPKGTAYNSDPKWVTPCRIERRRHSMANCGWTVRYRNGHTRALIGTAIALSNIVRSTTLYDLLFPKHWSLKCTPRDKFRMAISP